MLITDEGATPETPIVPATGKTVVTLDTANRIAELERDLNSANSKIGELNKECKNYRLLNNAVEQMGATPETLKAQLESQKAEIDGYRALGNADEIKTRLESGDVAISEASAMKRDVSLSAAGYDPAKVNALRGVESWQFGEEKSTVNGKEVTIITAKNGEDKSKPLDELMREQFPAMVDSLRIVQPSNGTPHIRQSSGNQGETTLSFEQMKARKLASSQYPST